MQGWHQGTLEDALEDDEDAQIARLGERAQAALTRLTDHQVDKGKLSEAQKQIELLQKQIQELQEQLVLSKREIVEAKGEIVEAKGENLKLQRQVATLTAAFQEKVTVWTEQFTFLTNKVSALENGREPQNFDDGVDSDGVDDSDPESNNNSDPESNNNSDSESNNDSDSESNNDSDAERKHPEVTEFYKAKVETRKRNRGLPGQGASFPLGPRRKALKQKQDMEDAAIMARATK